MSNKDYTKYAKAANETVEEVIETPVETAPEIEPIVEEVVVEEAPEIPQHKTGRVFSCAKLNVRKAPHFEADVVCEIPVNTEVEINEAESTNDFYKICTASGIEGFCMKSYILEK